MNGVAIRELTPADEAKVERVLDVELGGRDQARLGEVTDVLALPGFCAWLGARVVGVGTYALEAGRAELAAIAVSREHRLVGIGSAPPCSPPSWCDGASTSAQAHDPTVGPVRDPEARRADPGPAVAVGPADCTLPVAWQDATRWLTHPTTSPTSRPRSSSPPAMLWPSG